MKEDKLIIFGPWVGEFSYEFCWWVPQIREIKNKLYTNYHSLAISFNGRQGFYKDFTDGYLPYPKILSETLQYPSCWGEFVNGREVIPSQFFDFVNKVKREYENDFDEVKIIFPRQEEFSSPKIYTENPKGERIHYTPNPDVEKEIKNLIKTSFNEFKDMVTIMARNRSRFNTQDNQTLPSKTWGQIIKNIIDHLDVNVILLGFEKKHSSGGSYILDNFNLSKNYNKRILSIPIKGDNSVEKQFSILKNTKCSFYGGSGAAHLPFFMNTPVFIHQTKENGFKLKYNWQKKLTNNHKNVKIFDKYPANQFPNTPAEELTKEFFNFYKSII